MTLWQWAAWASADGVSRFPSERFRGASGVRRVLGSTLVDLHHLLAEAEGWDVTWRRVSEVRPSCRACHSRPEGTSFVAAAAAACLAPGACPFPARPAASSSARSVGSAGSSEAELPSCCPWACGQGSERFDSPCSSPSGPSCCKACFGSGKRTKNIEIKLVLASGQAKVNLKPTVGMPRGSL